MGLGTFIALAAGGFFAYEAFGKKSSGGGAATTTTTPAATCIDTAKDCAALIACAGPIIAKATAADTVTLTKMSSKAAALGCASLVSDIAKKLADLGLGGVGVKTDDAAKVGASGYSIRQGVGPVSEVSNGDMIIVGLTDAAKSRNYLTPLIFSNTGGEPTGTFEKALAAIALSKFKDQVAKTGVDPTSLLGAFLVVGAPDDLNDGASFPISLRAAGLALGDVVAVVTAAEMKSGLTTFTPAPGMPPADKFGLAGEDDFLAPQGAFGSGFGSRQRNLGSNFGGGSRFGTTRVGG